MLLRRTLPCLALFALVTTAVADDPKPVYKLPAGAKTPVLELDFKGGFTPPRKKNDPALSILADGTVLCPDRFGTGPDASDKISAEDIQSLLRYVLAEKKFAEIDGKAIKQAVQAEQKKRGGFAPVVADAPSTWVRVSIDGKQYETQYYALGMAARQYPGVQSLTDFNDVATRLQRVMNVAKGGGREKVTRMLLLANAELKKKFPGADPLKLEHLRSAYVGRDGTTRYSFGWNAQGMPGVPATNTYVSATVSVPKQGEPMVSVRAKL